jgi:hypothetical protein
MQGVGVLVGLHRDVVAQPLRLLVRVGVTPHVDQQGCVVNRDPVVLSHADLLGEPERDQALPEHVLHRLTEPEVDPERQRGHELREPDVPLVAVVNHEPSVRAATSCGQS